MKRIGNEVRETDRGKSQSSWCTELRNLEFILKVMGTLAQKWH